MCDSEASVLPRYAYSVLAHLEVQKLADEIGVRLLHFKGRIGQIDFPDRGGSASDADILVEPDRVRDLAEHMVSRGWTLSDSNLDGLSGHGQALRHPLRAVEVDLHHYAQGMRATWADGFEKLWDYRRTTRTSSPHYCAPSHLDHAIILLADSVSDAVSTAGTRAHRRQAVMKDALRFGKRKLAARAEALGLLTLINDGSLAPLSRKEQFRQRLVMGRHSSSLRGLSVWTLRIIDEPSLRGKVRVFTDSILWGSGNVPATGRVRYVVKRFARTAKHIPLALNEAARAALGRPSKALEQPPYESVCNDVANDTDETVSTPPTAQPENDLPADTGVSGPPETPEIPTSPSCWDTGNTVWFLDKRTVYALDLDSKSPARLDGVGFEVWRALANDQTHRFDSIIDAVLSSSDDAPDDGDLITRQVLDQLVSLRLISAPAD
ncbi:MAG: nucleotidyltransferase family protein [Actinomycetaceae bacterium]|nr:nucleotidyltransferase family protein [Actinomycetaceae bacterium]